MQHALTSLLACFVLISNLSAQLLPEHPRPDWERPEWLNLNGPWAFRFDPDDAGLEQSWHKGQTAFPLSIQVPFSWAAPLSGLADSADIGWYQRDISVPADWKAPRTFLVIGAADWHTTVWLDGRKIGEHRGGYTPFALELTAHVRRGQPQRLTIRVDDRPHPFKLEGKQGYGKARGIWQTVYLEARGEQYLETLHIRPNIREGKAVFEATLPGPAAQDLPLRLLIRGEDGKTITAEQTLTRGAQQLIFEAAVPNARLWSLETPHLYTVEARLGNDEPASDQVRTYFGMREVSVTRLPGTDYSYVALNGQPVYLQLALDQAYHPEGFYTFPTDAFIRDEVLRARQIGLNGLRVHVKVGQPRKLYWADRLGVLIMADVPNSWGEPDAEMRRESEYALRNMIRRDFNHPAIFSWVVFNETWGLFSTVDAEKKERRYLPETKKWVEQMVALAKTLDPSRLVEDNSPCCGIGHTVTDLNSWHSYLPGWAWEETLAQMDTATYPGSSWNFEEGYRQGAQPNINSEFGNVWGYEGSTGDVDWSWDYHRAIDAFRRHPRVAGWLYTEHHDVINEWNGYWRFDRSEKETGLGGLVAGMSLRDLHSPLYIAAGEGLSRSVHPGEQVEVPLFASFFTGAADLGDSLLLRSRLYGWDYLGREETYAESIRRIPYRPWMQGAIGPATATMPGKPAVAVLALTLEDASGKVHHRNFTTFVVEGEAPGHATLANGRQARLLRVKAGDFSRAEWSQKQWDVLDGKKVNGAGHGFFEYRFPWPKGLKPESIETAGFLAEASAKQLFGKDQDEKTALSGDYMRGEGTFDPSRNPNAYPMTDETPFPSAVHLTANGLPAGRYELPDDPADHRGILSWHAQLKDRRLREAGSYGYLMQATIPKEALKEAARTGVLVLRLAVEEGLPGGLAVYGAEFGRYPLEPTVVLVEAPR